MAFYRFSVEIITPSGVIYKGVFVKVVCTEYLFICVSLNEAYFGFSLRKTLYYTSSIERGSFIVPP